MQHFSHTIKKNACFYLFTEDRGRKITNASCMCVHACIHVSVRHVFTQTLISHSFIQISSPNLQELFMAMKICLCKIWKTKWPTYALNLKILQVASSNLHQKNMGSLA